MIRDLLARISQTLVPRRATLLRANASPLAAYVDISGLWPAQRTVRLGTDYGGWLIPTDAGLTTASVCYLAGAGEDISFDCELVRRFGCRVRIIDPTPRAIQHFQQLARAVMDRKPFPINNSQTSFYTVTAAELSRMTFLPVGLADKDDELKFYMPSNPAYVSCSTLNLHKTSEYFTAPCQRLRTLMEAQGDASVDLLKMDIEGGEYSVIQDMTSSGLVPRILLVEFDEAHTPLDSDAGGRIRAHIARLAKVGMRCVAIEGSNATFVRAL